jgi:hypothetical protein
MRIAGIALALAMIGCSHGSAGSNLSVTIMHTGAVYPPLPPDCPVEFVNAQHIAILTSGEYDQLGLISIAGTGSEVDQAISKLPDAVATAACKMGGTAVSIANMMRTSADQAVLQFSIWRALKAKEASSQPAKPAGNNI